MYSDELMHYGVLGMKWGVRRNRINSQAREQRLKTKATKFAEQSVANAKLASDYAKRKVNGSPQLSASDRDMKKAYKVASKMNDSGKSLKKSKTFKQMSKANREAAKNYVERTKSEKLKSAATTAAISTGASIVGMAAGIPIGVLYINPGGKYKLKG